MKTVRLAIGVLICVTSFSFLSFASPVIFGAAYAGSSGPASLYSIDPLTGAGTLIGAIGFQRVSAMDFAANGTLYAIGSNAGTTVLLTIDTSTGVGTQIGGLGAFAAQDMSFRSDGTLFSYNGGNIYTENTSTGAATLVGSDGIGFPLGNGIGFDGADTLWYVDQSQVGTVNQSTGAITLGANLTFDATSGKAGAIDFDLSTGKLYATMLTGGGAGSPTYLATIDPTTGQVTTIGASVNGLDAIAVQSGSVPEPSSLILLSTGALSLLGWARRRSMGQK